MILVFLEALDGKVSSASRSALTAAMQISAQTGATIAAFVAGHHVDGFAAHAQKFGVSRVFIIDDPRLEQLLPDVTAKAVVQVARQCQATVLIGAATANGKSIMPRAAALLNAAMAPDIVGVLPDHMFKRPVFSGKLYQVLRLHSSVQVITVRSSAFPAAEETGERASHKIVPLDTTIISKMRVGGHERTVSARPSLTEAKIVVSGGRGLRDADSFKRVIEPLADALGAAIGASRAVVDSGWAPNDLQVGQTGKQVAPAVYIAVGISGAIQHLAGMRTARTIVVINKDREAPFFGIADYGLVGDLFMICPALVEAVKATRTSSQM